MRYGQTNLSKGSLFFHNEALPSDARQGPDGRPRDAKNSDPWDRFVCPYLTLIIDSFFCTHFVFKRLINFNFTLTYAAHSRQPFCFDVIF